LLFIDKQTAVKTLLQPARGRDKYIATSTNEVMKFLQFDGLSVNATTQKVREEFHEFVRTRGIGTRNHRL